MIDNIQIEFASDGLREIIRGGQKNRTIIGRELAAQGELVAGKHEAPPLDNNVAHRSDAGGARVSAVGAQ